MADNLETSRTYYLEERREQILSLLEADSVVRIADLSERFGVSTATIRKDIRSLESEGKLRHTHGGAIRVNPDTIEMDTKVAASTAHAEKERIGRQAARFVSDGDIFFVQSGTTCLEFVRSLKGKQGLTLVTSDLVIAMTAEDVLVDSNIVMLGGTLRTGFHYTQGPEALKQLENYFVPTAYLCSNAFSFEQGFSAHRIEQANWVHALLAGSKRHIMLLDSSKIGVSTLAHAASPSDLDCLVTDDGASSDFRARIAQEAPALEVIYA